MSDQSNGRIKSQREDEETNSRSGMENRDKLLLRMKRTKSNRFNYAERLRYKAEIKSHTINILSVFVILSGVYFLAYSEGASFETIKLFGFIVTGISVSSIVLSLQNPVSELSRRAADAHRCARDISGLYGILQEGIKRPEEVRAEYEGILNQYDNHNNIDNWKTLYERKSDFPDDSKEVNWFRGVFLYWASVVSAPISAAAMLVTILLLWRAIIYLNTLPS